MDIDQCVEIITSLKDVYQRVAHSSTVPWEQVYKLKHALTEIELSMISMRKSIQTMETKLTLRKEADIKKQST